VRVCVHRDECLYVYEYLRLYCVLKKISREHKARDFRLVQSLAWSNSPTSSIDVLCIEIGSSVFLSRSTRCGSTISIYSRGTAS
jgi:hypothetical protein